MLSVDITTSLSCATSAEIEIPNVSDWSEIKDWYIKWDSFNYTVDGETWESIDLESEPNECIDWKRPIHTRIRETSETLGEAGKLLADVDD